MTENRVGSLLVAGGLGALSMALRVWGEGARDRSERRSLDVAPDRIPSPPTPATAASPLTMKHDPDKRPKEQIENDQPTVSQVGRAKEKGRGRHALAPWRIPLAGWKDILW